MKEFCLYKCLSVTAADDNISVELSGNYTTDYSSRGPTPACVKKPDIVAPGSNIYSCRAINRYNYRNSKVFYIKKSGTSMSTPIVTGAIALLLSRYPNMTTRDVKLKIYNSSDDIGLDKNQQGCGMLNIEKLLG